VLSFRPTSHEPASFTKPPRLHVSRFTLEERRIRVRYRKLFVLWLALWAGGLAVPLRAEDRPEPPLYGLQAMARFDRLPVLRDAVCKQVSSYDREGRNRDAGQFLNGFVGRRSKTGPIVREVPGDRALLADLQGPGCIYRIWS